MSIIPYITTVIRNCNIIGKMDDQTIDNKQNFTWTELFRSIWFLLDKNRTKFLFWWSILIFVHFYSVVPPLLIGKIVDFFTIYKSNTSLTKFYILALTLGISYALVSFIRLSVKQVLGNLRSEVAYFIKVKGFENLLNLSLKWHDSENTGSKVKKIENGIDAYKNLIGRMNNDLIHALTLFIGVITVFIFLNPKYILFFFIYAITFYIILKYYYKKIQISKEEYNASTEKSGGSYVEGLGNILTIKTLGANDSFRKHISEKEELAKKNEYRTREIGINMWRTYQIFNGLCYGIFLLMVGVGVANGEISTGSIVIFYGYLSSLTGSSNSILEIYEELLGAKISIGRMMPILYGSEIDSDGNLNFPKMWSTITLKKVNFKYESGSKSVDLSDINFTIRRGEKIGIVGKTGSGKSTLAKVLSGLYKIKSGEYQIDDANFYNISKSQISGNISLVLQDSEMFNLSLNDNITLLRKIKQNFITTAIDISQLNDVIKKLPEGVNTLIGEKGYHLSGGERQRVGIARVICKNPEIIIFDEATSSLDNKTEKLVHDSIEKKLIDKTMIIIAHRISTLRNTDRIYVFDKGRIIESGTFDQLSTNNKSKFYKIYNPAKSTR